MLEPLLEPRDGRRPRIAVVGAGNGDTLPLNRLTAKASQVTLIDLDRRAIASARRRVRLSLRSRMRLVAHDITEAAADAAAAAGGEAPPRRPDRPLPGAPYDLIVGDLLYSQLLYPALVDLGLGREEVRRRQALAAAPLVELVVRRLHLSARNGIVVHLHDPLAWWKGHPQPVALETILETATMDTGRALALADRGRGPKQWDPRPVVERLRHPVRATAMWHWPFAEDVDYLVCATVAAGSSVGD